MRLGVGASTPPMHHSDRVKDPCLCEPASPFRGWGTCAPTPSDPPLGEIDERTSIMTAICTRVMARRPLLVLAVTLTLWVLCTGVRCGDMFYR